MTCKEKFEEQHANMSEDRRYGFFNSSCPADFGYADYPHYCSEGTDMDICNKCWDREFGKTIAADEDEIPMYVEPKLPPKVAYLCDHLACENCSYPTCKHTTDIRHAVHFQQLTCDGNCENKYMEMEYDV